MDARSDYQENFESLAPFASPDTFDPALRNFLYQACDLLCDWFASAAEFSPLPNVHNQPEVAPPNLGRNIPQLLSDLQVVMGGAFQPSHPGSLAHLDPPPLTASIAAELICAGINNNLLAEELSPGLSILEKHLCNWFSKRLGLSEESGGVLASGGTLSNLMALVVARNQISDSIRGVVICSTDAHVSLQKAIRVMGLEEDGLQKINVDESGRMCLEDLEKKLYSLREQNRPCIAIVATAGTTVRGAIDPLSDIAYICEQHGIWFHVDAAIGGVFALTKTTASLMNGIEHAASITLNPQKVLGITKSSSILLLNKPILLQEAFSTGLPYMNNTSNGRHGGEIGLQGTRPAEVLKLWLGLRQLGENGIEKVLCSCLDRCKLMRSLLNQDRLIALSGSLHLLAIRPRDTNTSSDHWTMITHKRLLKHGFMLSRPLYNSIHHLKIVFGNPHTSNKEIERLAFLLNQVTSQKSRYN